MQGLTRREFLRRATPAALAFSATVSTFFGSELPFGGRGSVGVVFANNGGATGRDPLAIEPGAGWRTSSEQFALGLYRPSFPDDLTAADEHDRATGARLGIVHWYALWGGWKRDFQSRDLDRVQLRGSVPMITWEPWAGRDADPDWTLQAAILSGANDDYIDSWARGLADFGGPIFLRFAHEMHGSRYPWAVGVNGNSAEDYVEAWSHVRAIFSRYATSNVRWVWNPNAVGEWSAADYEPVYRALYPGDDLVDWVGIDVYNTGPRLDWGAPYWRSFADILAEPYKALTRISGKPIVLPEVGCAELGGSKPKWIHDAILAELPTTFPRVAALIWFDVVKEEQWALNSSSQAVQAWRSAARGLTA